jgi:hypothetical protein
VWRGCYGEGRKRAKAERFNSMVFGAWSNAADPVRDGCAAGDAGRSLHSVVGDRTHVGGFAAAVGQHGIGRFWGVRSAA